MARPKEFDTDAALDRAVDVFWLHGYEATSLAMLLESMEIGRQSLYDTFGGKRELFLAALARYDERTEDLILTRLKAPDAGLTAIREHFGEVIEQLSEEKPCRACFVVNTTMELAPHDPEIAQALRRSVRRMEQALRHAVEGGQARGEITGRHEARALARYLTSLGLGLAVSAKSGASRRALEETVQVALDAL